MTYDGEVVEARTIEMEIEELVDAIHYCMIVSHPTSDELGCLLTLRAAVWQPIARPLCACASIARCTREASVADTEW